MNYSIISLTNAESERTISFIDNSSKKNNLIVNIIASNKHEHPILNIMIYLFFSPLVILSIFLNIIFRRYEKKVIVTFPGVLELLVLKIFSFFINIDIYFDFFTGFHLTLVSDRNKFSRNGFIAKLLLYIDKLIFKLSDFQIVETDEMREYIRENISVNTKNVYTLQTPRKQIVLKEKQSKKLRIAFWGNFAEMHGLDYILDAAKQIKDKQIIFDLIGDGELFDHIEQRVKVENINNVILHGYLPYIDSSDKNVTSMISSSRICLGTFSNTVKNNLVVPHKVIEALSFSKPVITAATKVVNNRLINIVQTVEPENGEDLATKIIEVINNDVKLEDMSTKGYHYYTQNFSEASFTKKLKFIIDNGEYV